MKKRGFTLIELLAVIVILAIIALIATPIVMNLIENSRKGAAERSAENLEHSAEIYYYNKKLDGGFSGITFTCTNGCCSSNGETLEISGKVPEVGSIIINKDGTINLSSIVINGYNCYKENDSYTCDKVTKETAETTNGFLTLLNSGGKNLVNYKTYGNSEKIGLNLYQNMTFTEGYIVSPDGTPGENVNYKISDYLEVEANETYISQMMNNYNATTGTLIRCWSYDENKNPNSILFENNRFDIGIYKNEFTIPENAKYIRISYRITDTDIEFYKKNPTDGETGRIEVVGNKVSIDNQIKYEIPIRVTGKNLFSAKKDSAQWKVKTEILENKIIRQTGSSYESSAGYSQFIVHLIPGTYIASTKITGNCTGTGNPAFHVWGAPNAGSIIKVGYLTPNSVTTTKFNITQESDYWVALYGQCFEGEQSLFEVQIEYGNAATSYEPYKEETYSIYLDEPLRCVDNTCDYIDFRIGKVARNVGVDSDGSLVKLEESTSQDIDLPNIKLNKGINNIFVETDIKPSKVEIEYYK